MQLPSWGIWIVSSGWMKRARDSVVIIDRSGRPLYHLVDCSLNPAAFSYCFSTRLLYFFFFCSSSTFNPASATWLHPRLLLLSSFAQPFWFQFIHQGCFFSLFLFSAVDERRFFLSVVLWTLVLHLFQLIIVWVTHLLFIYSTESQPPFFFFPFD